MSKIKYKVYQEKEEKVIRLKLTEDNDYINLIAVNENGEKIENGNLIYFNKETGEFFLYYKVNPELGLPLDDKGQVVVGDFNTKEDSKIERCGFY